MGALLFCVPKNKLKMDSIYEPFAYPEMIPDDFSEHTRDNALFDKDRDYSLTGNSISATSVIPGSWGENISHENIDDACNNNGIQYVSNKEEYVFLSWTLIHDILQGNYKWHSIPDSFWQRFELADHLLKVNIKKSGLVTYYSGCTYCGKCLKCSRTVLQQYPFGLLEFDIPGLGHQMIHFLTCSKECFHLFAACMEKSVW
jgi:hypothetical protein